MKITEKSSDAAIAEDRRRTERLAHDQKLTATAQLIAPIADNLRQLPKDQIEEVVLWLKTVHDVHADFDGEANETERFIKKLEEIRDSSEQHELQMKAAKMNVWAITCGSGASALLCLAIVTGFVTERWLVPALMLIPMLLLFGKGFRLGARAIEISKVQERQFRLLAQKEARSVEQLYEAGLFGFPLESAPVPYDDKVTALIDSILLPMRDAIYRRAGEGDLKRHFESRAPEEDGENYGGDDDYDDS